jgi:hypothetical protein
MSILFYWKGRRTEDIGLGGLGDVKTTGGNRDVQRLTGLEYIHRVTIETEIGLSFPRD